MAGTKPDATFVVCLETGGYVASLELWKIYRALRDDDAHAHGQLRVVDESGQDYLYPARYFQSIELPPSLQALYPSAAAGRGID